MIVGSKVFIRAVEKEDLERFQLWSNDFQLKELFDFVIDFTNDESLVCDYVGNGDFGSNIYFTIVEIDTKKPVGRCTLSDIDYVNKKCNCSLYIGDVASQNKGYGTEAMRLLMKYAFDDLNLNRIGTWVFDFNKGAIKCFKRCGMKVEGIMRDGVYRNGKYHDVYFMGVLKSEYLSMSKGGRNEECSGENL